MRGVGRGGGREWGEGIEGIEGIERGMRIEMEI
jgi:hypothetical protein